MRKLAGLNASGALSDLRCSCCARWAVEAAQLEGTVPVLEHEVGLFRGWVCCFGGQAVQYENAVIEDTIAVGVGEAEQ